MFNRDLISTIISTSDYSVLSTLTDYVSKVLTEESTEILRKATDDARKRLDRELLLSGVQSVSIPKGVDPLTVITHPEEEVMDKLIDALERGFDGERIYGECAAMCNVGFMRKAEGRVSHPNELFSVLEAVRQMFDLTKEDISEDELVQFAQLSNMSTLAMCADTPDIRNGIIEAMFAG